MANKPKYSKKTLREAVERYFKSITRKVKLTEKVATGKKDKDGHVIYKDEPVINELGEQVEIIEYLVVPSVGGLSDFLGIHRSTWDNYCDADKHPEFFDTTTYAQGRMRTWREEQLHTRKDVKGLIFDLENNYGYKEHKDIHVTGSVEEFLKTLGDQGEGVQQF